MHVDRGAIAQLLQLVIRPGQVAREYVDGARQRYFNPFTMLVVIVGLASLLMVSTNFVIPPDKSVHPVSAILQRNLNLLILAQVPLLAFVSTLFFRHDQLRFSEHLVLTAYTSSLRSVFFMLLVLPAWWLFNLNYNLIVAAYMTLWVLYFGFASSQFYRGKRLWLGFKGVLVAALAQAITMLVITAAYSAYFYYFHKR